MARRNTSSRAPLTTGLPVEPVPTTTGYAELVPDPGSPRSFTLMLDGVPSSHVDLDDPEYLEFEYMQQMAAVLDRCAAPRAPLDVVHLGAAGCSLARYVHATRPRSRQLAVEIDATLAAHVRTWFDLPRSPALRIRVGDARAVLASLPSASADVVIRDVFADAHTPEHLITAEFATEAARVLRPGGVYLANCADRPPLALARSEVATVRAVFDVVTMTAEPAQLRGRRYGNVVIAASDDDSV
ncbi:MAG: fused MFS/spermidine synthase, partial [Actinomycetota bacterium]|nr:fused MFS/spermidine synthase [Actinomycetota bacterium]